MTGIIILNWNGWEDTIACLQSLYRLEKSEYFIMVVDNGSNNKSVSILSEWLNKGDKTHYIIKQDEELNADIKNGDCILYCLDQNYGFAKGNNYAIELAKTKSPDYLILLNNDTEVESDFLYQLETFLASHIDYKALTPMIRYYGEKDKIWNCGGKLFFGLRKYNYADSFVSTVKEKDIIPISLITGCALFFPLSLLDDGPLLTERFFFGEEDFDFSIRMQEKGYKMGCVLTSQIYHKVSSSTTEMNSLSRIYIHYLNRFIDMRLHFNPLKFYVWRQLNYLYIMLLLKRRHIPFFKIKILIKLLSVNHTIYDGVSQELFFATVTKEIDEIK